MPYIFHAMLCPKVVPNEGLFHLVELNTVRLDCNKLCLKSRIVIFCIMNVLIRTRTYPVVVSHNDEIKRQCHKFHCNKFIISGENQDWNCMFFNFTPKYTRSFKMSFFVFSQHWLHEVFRNILCQAYGAHRWQYASILFIRSHAGPSRHSKFTGSGVFTRILFSNVISLTNQLVTARAVFSGLRNRTWLIHEKS